MSRERKTYTADFKLKAVKSVDEQGGKIVDVSKYLNIPIPTLNKWLKEYRATTVKKTTGKNVESSVPRKTVMKIVKVAKLKPSKKSALKQAVSRVVAKTVRSNQVKNKAKASIKKMGPSSVLSSRNLAHELQEAHELIAILKKTINLMSEKHA